VAVVQIGFFKPLPLIPLQTYLLLGLVGVYTIVKILFPFRWYQKDFLTYLVLGADLLVCTLLLFLTGGLASAFLLYSLNPILTMALLLQMRFALAAAAFSSLAALGSQLFYSRMNLATSPLHEYLGISTIYIIVCFLTAWLPFLINTGVRFQIEEKAATEEGNRLAQELHDNLAQGIAYLRLKTRLVKDSVLSKDTQKTLGEVSDLNLIADDLYEDARESIDLLRDRKLESTGLIPTLSNYVQQFGQRTGIKTEFSVSNGQVKLSPLAELQLIRIIQEALTNIRRHANASKVEVRLTAGKHWTEISLTDDGRGFDPIIYQHGKENGHHIGLRVMKERAESVGGTFSILTGYKMGTRVLIRIPAIRGVLT